MSARIFISDLLAVLAGIFLHFLPHKFSDIRNGTTHDAELDSVAERLDKGEAMRGQVVHRGSFPPHHNERAGVKSR
jgi:hypothetical protein